MAGNLFPYNSGQFLQAVFFVQFSTEDVLPQNPWDSRVVPGILNFNSVPGYFNYNADGYLTIISGDYLH